LDADDLLLADLELRQVLPAHERGVDPARWLALRQSTLRVLDGA
jgi:hypothetical protein